MRNATSNFQLQTSHGAVLGEVVSQFPELHETFIVRELAALREAGIPLRIYSLKRCTDRIVHPEALSMLEQTTRLAWNDGTMWAAAARELVRHPLRGLWTLGWTVRYHHWPAATLCKALIVWVQGCALARQMRRDGTTHIHAHWATMPTTAAAIASRWLGIPFRCLYIGLRQDRLSLRDADLFVSVFFCVMYLYVGISIRLSVLDGTYMGPSAGLHIIGTYFFPFLPAALCSIILLLTGILFRKR